MNFLPVSENEGMGWGGVGWCSGTVSDGGHKTLKAVQSAALDDF